MSQREVKGLQDLARAHGGSLSINPQTGLPEAGFLESILPMVAGAALNTFMPGLGTIGAGLLTGAVTGMASGSLSKGLMAGLGAYGGAGLMGGLIGTGTDAAAGMLGAENAATAANMGEYANARDILMARNSAPAMALASSPTQSALAGLQGLGTEAGRASFMNNIGGASGLMKYGMAAAAPVLAAPETTTKQPEIKKDADPGQRYEYSPGRTEITTNDPYSREQTYFQPKFNPITPTTARSIYGYADGGPIETMSNANAIGANTGYPMADINKGAYAYPWQTPISQNVVAGSQDIAVDPYTGQEQRTSPAPVAKFADGGGVGTITPEPTIQYTYDPLNQLFNKIESMPSDNQGQAPQAAQAPQMGGGYSSTQGNQTPGTRALPSAMVEGGGNITPMAYPSLALSKIGDAAQMGLGYLAFKMSKPNPNPQNVQVVDAGDMLSSKSALADTQAKAEANNAQQAQAIAAVLSALQGAGGTGGEGGTSAGFGTPGATTGNAGALGFGPAGMAGQTAASTTSPSAAAAALHGAGGGGGGGGGGGVSTGSGSGGGAAAMGTGAHGMAAGRGSAAGAARGGLMAAYASGGSHLGDYSDGGRLLRGPGDGVSDSIPAMIGKKQPARLADGEFVVPARIVSELGNGSTEAGARKLYAMMDRVQNARSKTVGKGKVAKNSRADKYLPA
jgi:hypothetical protein